MICHYCGKLIENGKYLNLNIEGNSLNFCGEACRDLYIESASRFKNDGYLTKHRVTIECHLKGRYTVEFYKRHSEIEILKLIDMQGNVIRKNSVGMFTDSRTHLSMDCTELEEMINDMYSLIA